MKTVVRLMKGNEKRKSDCHDHALWLHNYYGDAIVVLEDGSRVKWPRHLVADDATEEEKAEFYNRLTVARKKETSNE